jgi:hypothetical protein
MANIQTVNIPSTGDVIVKGDTFTGIQFTVNVNGSPLDLTNYTINCQIRKYNAYGAVLKQLTTTSGIVKTTPLSGVFTISPFIVDFVEGIHVYDIEFITGSEKYTYIQGTFTVNEQVTSL